MPFMRLLPAVAVFGTAVHAVAFPGPAETVLPTLPSDGVTPVPTEAPLLKELMRRAESPTTVYFAEDNTCGYVSGSILSAYTCYSQDAQCAIITVSSEGFLGCCDSYECAGFYVDCLDSDAYASSCGSDCMSDTFTLKCTAFGYPYCNSATINGGSSLKVYGYYCGDVPVSSYQPLWTTYSGQAGTHSFSPSVLDSGGTASAVSFGGGSETAGGAGDSTSDAAPAATGRPSSSPSSTSSGSGSSSGGGDSSSSDSDRPQTEEKKKTNVGAIAGGVVGGVVGLAAIGAIVAFALLKKKRRNAQKQQPLVASAAAVAPGPGGGGGVAPPGNPGMVQVGPSPPPPSGVAYGQPGQPGYDQKIPPVYAAPGSPQPAYANAPQQPQYYQPPQQPQQQHQQPGMPQPPQAAYYPTPPVGDTNNNNNMAISPQEYNRMSSVSSASGIPQPSPISPQPTGTSLVGGGFGSNAQGQSQVPPTIHEAGGNTVGTADANPNHRGEMHELA